MSKCNCNKSEMGIMYIQPSQLAAPPVVPREPVVLPGPGQTKYRKPEAVEAFKKKQEEAAVRKADKVRRRGRERGGGKEGKGG